MIDPTEGIRKEMIKEININPGEREFLERKYGQVWSTEELTKDFDVIGFLAPFITVVRKSDGVKGSMLFQHNPRFYYSFQES